MKKFLFLFFVLFTINLSGQNFWHVIDENSIMLDRDQERGVIPISYTSYKLNLSDLAKYLNNAPKQFNLSGQSLPVSIPMPDGNIVIFNVVKSPVMMPELAKKYPNISSYKGISTEDPKVNIRFNIGAKGFFASIFKRNHNIYIDPFAAGNKDYYVSYYTSDYKVDISNYNLTCGLDNETIEIDNDEVSTEELLSFRDETICDSVKQYNYRLALACTGEWGQRHGGTKEKALSDMVTSVNRINQIYENEFAIHLNLIGNNDTLIWLDPDTDPYDNPTLGGALLGENFDAVNNLIGLNAYDIGHVFTNSCTDVGGIAGRPSVCTTGKARGVTCHYANDLNYIITNVTAHEMGHQFSANHTFNNCRNDGNESSTGFEPGGGTTIMAYCGLCGPNNVDYPCLETFHSFTIDEVKEYTRVGGGRKCAEIISSDNTAPEVSFEYKDGFYIPLNTPFVLEGSVYDCEGDELTYSWEEMDLGPITSIGNPTRNSPLFTAKEISNSPIRYFPSLDLLLVNQSNNSEILPTYGRDLTFRFIARDNHPKAGGTDWKDLSFKADSFSGPFLVTYPNDFAKFVAGEGVEVTWDIANTDNENVNCQNVDILLSVDIGQTYPFTLKYHTPNDGKELVYLPDTITNRARIMVKASDNIFFDVCNYNLKIKERLDTTFIFTLSEISEKICLPYSVDSDIKTRGTNGYSDSIRFEISGLPQNTEYTITPEIVKAGETAHLSFNFDNVIENGFFEPIILGISTSGDTISRTFAWEFFSNSLHDLEIISPLVNSVGVEKTPTFKWTEPYYTEYANIYISKDPSFPDDKTISKTFIQGNSFKPKELLDYSSLYFWKLEFVNSCGIVSLDTLYTFSTFATDCGTYSTEDVPRLINSKEITKASVYILKDSLITDLSLSMKGNHNSFKELSAFIVSPNLDTVLLFGNKSFNYQGNFSLIFDDEAYSYLKSNPKGTFKPDSSFAKFKNKSGKGEWILNVKDSKSQQSGTLQNFSMEICVKIALVNPELKNNTLLKIPYNSKWIIDNNHLRAIDGDNTSDELIFTIVREPKFCNLYLDNNILKIGSQFSQSDIDNSKLKIEYIGDEVVSDKFFFTVIDGRGGSIKITPFEVVSDPNINEVEDILNDYIHIFPNPAEDLFNVSIDKEGDYKMEIMNIEGQVLISKVIKGENTSRIDLSNLASGTYILKVNNAKYNYIRKFVKL